MSKIIVLGCGMVGSAMAKDLSKNHEVACADINVNNLKKLDGYSVEQIQIDFSKSELVSDIVDNYDFVLSAVPGFMGFNTLKTIIEAGKNVVDISFFPEDCFMLDELAKSKGVTAIVDFGVAPGIPNMLVGFHDRKMNVKDYKCYVGGLPKERNLPFQYKAPFSPIDVIEEYTRPARFVINNEIIVKEALTDSEFLNFDGIGTLEAFNTDGLRSLLFTNSIPNKIEKTLRYPGHIDLIKMLKNLGLFSDEYIKIGECSIKAIDFISQFLIDKWKLQDREIEFTVMRIIFEGTENHQNVKYTYNLIDYYDPETNISSMARTTGYSGTAAINLLVNNIYSNIGINPPEFVGSNDVAVDFVFNYLKERGVIYQVEKQLS